MLRLAVIVLVLVLAGETSAQSRSARNGAQRPTKAAVAAELARIDSAGDVARSIDERMRIAASLKGKEALAILRDAALLSDSLRDPWRGAAVRTRLMERYRSAGDDKRALNEAVTIIALWREGRELDLRDAAEEAGEMSRGHQHELDSLIALHEHSASASRDALGQAQQTIAQREMAIIAVGSIGIVLLLTAILVLRRGHRRAMEQVRRELSVFQARIAEMAEEMKGLASRMEAQRAAPPAAPSSEAPAPAAGKEALSPDPMVLALFMRQAPERIEALETARAANDHEKVLRVLHSLRPQLDALDPDGLGASCARLRAMRPSDADRDAGLDRLIAGMRALMAHR